MKLFRHKLFLMSGSVLGLLLIIVVGVFIFLHLATTIQAASASSRSGSSAADAAAIHYVEAHDPGSGQARVLQTEADHEHGIAVYDVRVLAPNSRVYVVHVRQSNITILSVNRAENQLAHASTAPAGSPSTAANAALHYVNIHYAGSGQARVLQTEADHEGGVSVYDVHVLAPNGKVYVVHVQQSNLAIRSINQAENQNPQASDN